MSDFFKFKMLYELNIGDVFKITDKGVYYTVISISDHHSMLIQTKYGKLRSYQKTGKELEKEVLYYPDKQHS